MFTLLVHTTHAMTEVEGCTEQLLLSNSAQARAPLSDPAADSAAPRGFGARTHFWRGRPGRTHADAC